MNLLMFVVVGVDCLQEKIVRVVHLWQKNSVFPAETLQSLLQLVGSGSSNSTEPAASQRNAESANSASFPGSLVISLFSVELKICIVL